jgi:hypothetical protein
MEKRGFSKISPNDILSAKLIYAIGCIMTEEIMFPLIVNLSGGGCRMYIGTGFRGKTVGDVRKSIGADGSASAFMQEVPDAPGEGKAVPLTEFIRPENIGQRTDDSCVIQGCMVLTFVPEGVTA